jgi:hypothetical protein
MNMTPLRGLPFGVRLNARLGVIAATEEKTRLVGWHAVGRSVDVVLTEDL